jgi:CheY-like chemotaxis protein
MLSHAMPSSEKMSRILVVDDEEAITEMLAALLESEHYDVDTASSGLETIAKLLRMSSKEIPRNKEDLQEFIEHLGDEPYYAPYALIVMDIKMPELDGFETITLIRKFAPQIKIIMMTAYGISQFRDQIRECGVEKVLRKPFEFEDFQRAVEKAVGC